MAFQPVQCGPFGPQGDIAADAFFRAQPLGKLPTRVGVVEAIDQFGRPPTVTVDGRRMRTITPLANMKIGDRVLWQPCGDAPFVIGTQEITPDIVSEQPTPCFYTNRVDATTARADYPAIRFRQWQGSSDSNGKAEWPTDLDPANVLVAHTVSPQYTSLSRQYSRPTTVRADGRVEVSQMAKGKPFRTVIIEDCTGDASAGYYRYVATGLNTASDEDGYAHPRWMVKSITDTLDTAGARPAGDAPNGGDPNNILSVHARAMVDGDSIDLSRFSELEYYSYARRAHADGSVIGGSSLAGAGVRISWFELPDTLHDPAGAGDLYVDYLGEEKIGESPQFQIVGFDAVFDSSGRIYDDIVFTNGEHRVNMVTGYTTGDLKTVGAELYSESANTWQFAEPRRAGGMNGQTVQAMALIMRGADLAKNIGDL